MPALDHDIVIEQGATFLMNMTYKNPDDTPVNLTGWTGYMQIRETIDSPTTIANLSTGSGVTLGGTAGTIVIEIDKNTTAAMDFDEAYYDLEIEEGAPNYRRYRMLQGKATLSKEVTR